MIRALTALTMRSRSRAPGAMVWLIGITCELTLSVDPIRPAPITSAIFLKSPFQRVLVVELPVGQNDENLVIDRRGRFLVDDQDSVEAACLLFGAERVHMGMIEKEPAVLGGEPVVERSSRGDRRLRQTRNAVHRIVDAQPVPAKRGRLVELIHQPHADLAAFLAAQHRAGHLAVIAPDVGFSRGLGFQPQLALAGLEDSRALGRRCAVRD